MIRSCSVYGCESKRGETVLHKLPIWNKYIDEFKTWVALMGNRRLLEHSPENVFNTRRICHNHFKKEDVVGNRIKSGAIPKLTLPEPISIPNTWYSVGLDISDYERKSESIIEPAFSDFWETSYATDSIQTDGSPRERVSPREHTFEPYIHEFSKKSHGYGVQETVTAMELELLPSTGTQSTMQPITRNISSPKAEKMFYFQSKNLLCKQCRRNLKKKMQCY